MPELTPSDAAPVRLEALEERRIGLERVVAALLDEARRLGASAAEAAASSDGGLSVTVRRGEIETFEHTRDNGLGVTVYFGHRKGSASTNDLSDKAVRESVAAACDFARHTSEDPNAGLADAALMATAIPDLDLCHPWPLAVAEAAEIARRAEAAALAFDPRIDNSEGATVDTHHGLHVYGNSHGFVGGYPGSRHSLSCAVIGREGDAMQRDYWYSSSRLPDQLEAAEAVGRIAAERTVARLGARRLSTRRVPVLFRAEVARGLLRSFVGAIRGAALYRKASFLLDALGQPVFPEFVRIHENPLLPRGPGSAPFDAEGVTTRPRDLVRDGVLQGYVLDSYSARKLDLTTTGNAGGVRNLMIDPGEQDLAGLLREMGTGLLVTEVMGQGVNPVTGDYSRGAAGFWIEGGEIRQPVEEITIAGNLREMFRQLLAVGADIDRRGNLQTGSWLIEQMVVAGE